jgi:hypothetical protein
MARRCTFPEKVRIPTLLVCAHLRVGFATVQVDELEKALSLLFELPHSERLRGDSIC